MLQRLEGRTPALVEHHDFTIDDSLPGVDLESGCGDGRIHAGKVFVVPGAQLDL
jgi:hypothetical protein